MGISVLDFPIDQSIRTETLSICKLPIAVGDNCIYFLKYWTNPRVIKVDLKNQATNVSNNFATEFGYSAGIDIFPIATGRNRNGNLYIDCLLIDESEETGSRNLYLRRFIVDPTDLTLSASAQRTLSGPANLQRLNTCFRFARFGETLITTCCKDWSNDADYALKVDLNGQRYQVIEIDTTGNPWNYRARWLCTITLDRATNTLYWLSKPYYWLPGSYAIVEILDFKDLTYVAHTTDYESGCGDVCAMHLYRDTNDKVRYYHVGNSGSPTYTSHFGTFYVNNGSIVVEAEHVIDNAYRDFSSGNVTPIPLGITSDNKIAWLLIGGCWVDNVQPSSNYTEGFQLITTDDIFDTPSKIASATYNVTTSDYRCSDERRCVFLCEDDWCYYAPNTILSSSPNDIWKWGKLDPSDIGITITEDDPYGTIIVPKTGLIPTTLSLQITPL